jgi:hypothetical protein
MSRTVYSRAICSLLFVNAAFAAVRGNCDRPFQSAFEPGAELHLDLRSGTVHITGSDDRLVRVTCEMKEPDRAKDVTITFEDSGKSGRLLIEGGPNGDVRMHIQVPREVHLTVRAKAGDLDVTGVRGHKDVSMRAGDISIDVGDPNDYSAAEASVTAGDVHASAFGVHKGGLFRSFKKQNSAGKYRLRASLWAGDIKLK